MACNVPVGRGERCHKVRWPIGGTCAGCPYSGGHTPLEAEQIDRQQEEALEEVEQFWRRWEDQHKKW